LFSRKEDSCSALVEQVAAVIAGKSTWPLVVGKQASLFFCLYVCFYLLFFWSICMYCLYAFLSVCPSFIFMSVFCVCWFVLSSVFCVCWFVLLSVCPSVCTSVYPFVCLSDKKNRQNIYYNFQYLVLKVFFTFLRFIKTLT
jgi:hypothetical protein